MAERGGFSAATREWFAGAFSGPTAAQEGAWRAISRGENTLVVAPTGSGKTLAAFLWSLDRLAAEPVPEDPKARCRVLYVSPLKALAVDVERNLRAPLTGIRHAARRLGLPEPDVRTAIRSGDTPADERRRQLTRPPDILITTPESLFLMLTSRARETLAGVETVIIDEVHAVAATKRGAHLALSLERLDALLPKPAQRIGLSATVRPLEEVAAFLGGARPATVVQPPSEKTFDLRVVVPVEDMGEMPQSGEDPRQRSIWPHVEQEVLDLIAAHRSTIVFANSRRLAERLCARLNELATEHLYGPLEEDHSPAAMMAQAGSAKGRPVPSDVAELEDLWAVPFDAAEAVPKETPEQADELAGGDGRWVADEADAAEELRRVDFAGVELGGAAEDPERTRRLDALVRRVAHDGAVEVARAHHGSVSKEERAAIEDALKGGRLPAVVATSSLELGIDMGAVDLVVQVESPPSVAGGLQRVGRAGHQVGAVSRGVIFPKYRGDLVQTAVVAERMREGAIEALRYPRNPLDVLAQQIVAMVAMDEWDVDELETVVKRAAPFAGLTRGVYEATLDMLAGRYPSEEFGELRPRLVWDRVAGVLRGRRGAQRLAVVSGGTIPDRGLFGVFLVGEKSSRVGELDEEMVYESRVGDVFVLGASSWRIEDITPDRVLVSPAPGRPGKLPFWHGDSAGRPAELGRALGKFTRELSALAPERAMERAAEAGLDPWAADNLVSYLAEQKEATGRVPDDRTLVVERFRDELGDWRLVVHSPYGALVHGPWALAIAARLRERYGGDAQAMHADDGIVLRVPDTDEPPSADLCVFDPDEIERVVVAELGSSALFAARFRECAARSLLLPRHRPDRRMPLWQQRQRAAQLLAVAAKYETFPIILETVRECLQDVFDVPGLVTLMRDIAARRTRVSEVETPTASPYAQSLLFRYIAAFMYEGDSPLAERKAQALSLDSSLLADLLGQANLRELLDAEVLAEAEAELQRRTPARRARDADALTDLLRALGPLTTEEAAHRVALPHEPRETATTEVPGPQPPAEPEHPSAHTTAPNAPFSDTSRDTEGASDAPQPPRHDDPDDPFSGTSHETEGASDDPRKPRHDDPNGPSSGTSRKTEDAADDPRKPRHNDPDDPFSGTSRETEGAADKAASGAARGAESVGEALGAFRGGEGAVEAVSGAAGGGRLVEAAEVAEGWLRELEGERRVVRVRVGGEERWAAVEDAGRLRDALGTPLPVGIPEAFLEPSDDPLGGLLLRHARTHVPFTAASAAVRYGLGAAVVGETLRRLPQLVEGEFTPDSSGTEWVDAEVLRMLRRRSLARLRAEVEPSPPEALARFLPRWQGVGGRQSGLDTLVGAIERLQGSAVPASALETLILPSRVRGYTPALLDELTSSGEVVWTGRGSLPGGDGWVSLYLADTAPLLLPPPLDITLTPTHEAVLDLLSDGSAPFFRTLSDRLNTPRPPAAPDQHNRPNTPERNNSDQADKLGAPGRPGPGQPAEPSATERPGPGQPAERNAAEPPGSGRHDERSAAEPPDPGQPAEPSAAGRPDLGRADLGRADLGRADLGRADLGRADGGGGAGRGGEGASARVDDRELVQVLWDLVWAGRLTNDTLAPLRAALGGGRPAHRAASGRRGRPVLPSRTGPPTAAGRWWLTPTAAADPTRRAHALAETLLDRYGVVLRGAVVAEHTPGGFAAVYPVLRAFEETARCRRGYFVDGLGAAQFALPGAVDRLRSLRSPAQDAPRADVLAATDPANPYGAALPWPETAGGHRPGRKAGALVVVVDGVLTLYAERGGRTLLTWNADALPTAVAALAAEIRGGSLGALTVERADGVAILESPLAEILESSGFVPTPRGYRLRRLPPPAPQSSPRGQRPRRLPATAHLD
ncbi:DEAD/DEAH box helicase [Actinocorallia sp. A-T 12471]|uniref:Lhr family helicase n=1 Tax=Actinocorallia sp. A-T 12471 TaxID=3089813 RepID=UPI0029D0D297|nr:DEAD/DEAH box helicase [Actinocorallia sp. A-T 12471]MDX6743442.1 DEAD/DEAH box helicase [Actinocorallia sp. A-T 12471]